jgi:hypothetical protein
MRAAAETPGAATSTEGPAAAAASSASGSTPATAVNRAVRHGTQQPSTVKAAARHSSAPASADASVASALDMAAAVDPKGFPLAAEMKETEEAVQAVRDAVAMESLLPQAWAEASGASPAVVPAAPAGHTRPGPVSHVPIPVPAPATACAPSPSPSSAAPGSGPTPAPVPPPASTVVLPDLASANIHPAMPDTAQLIKWVEQIGAGRLAEAQLMAALSAARASMPPAPRALNLPLPLGAGMAGVGPGGAPWQQLGGIAGSYLLAAIQAGQPQVMNDSSASTAPGQRNSPNGTLPK